MARQTTINCIVDNFLWRIHVSGTTSLTGQTLAEIKKAIDEHKTASDVVDKFLGIPLEADMTLAEIKAAIDESKTTVDAVKDDFPKLIERLDKVKISHHVKTVGNIVYTVASGTFGWIQGNEIVYIFKGNMVVYRVVIDLQ